MRNSGVPTILKWANNKNNNKLANANGKNGDKSECFFPRLKRNILGPKLIIFFRCQQELDSQPRNIIE